MVRRSHAPSAASRRRHFAGRLCGLSSGPTASPPTSTLDPRCHSMPLLQNEVICITGASRGIGECLAHCLAQERAKKLVLIAEDEEGLKTASGGRRRVWVGGSIATAQRAPAANGPRVRQLPLILAPAQPPCFRPPTRPSLRAPRMWRPSPATLRTQRPCRWVVRYWGAGLEQAAGSQAAKRYAHPLCRRWPTSWRAWA